MTRVNVILFFCTPLLFIIFRSGVVWRKERGRKIDMPPTEWPIHMEIARREGPLIQELNDSMAALMQKIAEDSDISAAEELQARRFVLCILCLNAGANVVRI